MLTNAFETELRYPRSSVLNLVSKFEVTHDPLPSMKAANPLRRKVNIREKERRMQKKHLPVHFLDAVT
jgi:hypothetical protein